MRVGRNEPCPCGSGKKYKCCCLDKRLPADKCVVCGEPVRVWEGWGALNDGEKADGAVFNHQGRRYPFHLKCQDGLEKKFGPKPGLEPLSAEAGS